MTREIREELEAVRRRFLELLVPLQTSEGSSREASSAEERLRRALWAAVKELDPLLSEFKEMESGARRHGYEVFFLGLVGEIAFYLDEAVEALWKGYRRHGFSNFRRNLSRDSRLSERAAYIIQRREQSLD